MRNRLREMREKYGLTQEEVAAHAGVSRQTIISLEKENIIPLSLWPIVCPNCST